MYKRQKLNRSLDDNKGVSMLIINTSKGTEYCCSFCNSKNQYSLDEVRRFNPAAYHSCTEPLDRKVFFGMDKSVHDRIKILARPTFKEIVRDLSKTIIREYLKINI